MSALFVRAGREPLSRARSLGWGALSAALRRAVRPDSDPCTLALVGFERRERLHLPPDADQDDLLTQLASCLARAAGEVCGLFESRRGEFCVLLHGPPIDVGEVLARIRHDLDELVRPLGAQTVIGIATLPGEAATPLAALAVADARLREFGLEPLAPLPVRR